MNYENMKCLLKILVKNFNFPAVGKKTLFFSFEKSTKLFVFDFEYTVIDSLSFICRT